MKNYEVTMTVTSEKPFRVEAASVQEAIGKAGRMLEGCEIFCFSKDEVRDMKIGCNEEKQHPQTAQSEIQKKMDSNLDVFCKNLFAFCVAAGGDEQEMKDGSEELFPDYRHNRLFGKNGYLLSETVGSGVSAMSTVTQGYEVWLLEDMTLTVTFCCQMTVDDRDGTCETAAYRYPIFGGHEESAAYFEADDILNDVENAIYAAMKME